MPQQGRRNYETLDAQTGGHGPILGAQTVRILASVELCKGLGTVATAFDWPAECRELKGCELEKNWDSLAAGKRVSSVVWELKSFFSRLLAVMPFLIIAE